MLICDNNNKKEDFILLAHSDNWGGKRISKVIFHPTNNDIIATCGNDKTAKIWQITPFSDELAAACDDGIVRFYKTSQNP